jgi:hypothetical protein
MANYVFSYCSLIECSTVLQFIILITNKKIVFLNDNLFNQILLYGYYKRSIKAT